MSGSYIGCGGLGIVVALFCESMDSVEYMNAVISMAK